MQGRTMESDDYARRAVSLAWRSLPAPHAPPAEYAAARIAELESIIPAVAGKPGWQVLTEELRRWQRHLAKIKAGKYMMHQGRIVTEQTEADAATILRRLGGSYVRPGSVCRDMARDDAKLAYGLLYHRALIVKSDNGMVRKAHAREIEATLRKRREMYNTGSKLFKGMENA